MILVTGCSGFIGQALVRSLLKDSLEVAGADTRECGIKDKNFMFYKADITDMKAQEKIFSENKIDYILHAASLSYSHSGYFSGTDFCFDATARM